MLLISTRNIVSFNTLVAIVVVTASFVAAVAAAAVAKDGGCCDIAGDSESVSSYRNAVFNFRYNSLFFVVIIGSLLLFIVVLFLINGGDVGYCGDITINFN